jgi:colanic acid biosynthesis glycosyl transferase WcaI
MLRNPVLVALSRRLAKWAYAMAEEIHTLGEGMHRRIGQMCQQVDKIRIVSDTVDVAELRPVPYELNEFRKQFVPTGTFAILHAGNMGRKQDLGVVLRAANRLRNETDVRFFVVGDGAERDSFLRMREAMGLENVSYYPLQPRAMVPHMLSGADVVIVSQVAEVVDIVVPSKLITAMACGAMIVASCAPESETARLVHEAGGGVVVAAGADDAMVEVINQVRQRSLDVAGHRDRVRRFASSRFDREAVYGGELRRLLAESRVRVGDSEDQVDRGRAKEVQR